MSKRIRQIRRKEKEIPITAEMITAVKAKNYTLDTYEYIPLGTRVEIRKWPDGKSSFLRAFVEVPKKDITFYIGLNCLIFDPRVVKNMKTKEFYLWYPTIIPSDVVLSVDEPLKVVDIVDTYTLLVKRFNETKTHTISIQRINFNKTYPLPCLKE